MLANIVVQFFLKGGPVMWPILICSFVTVAVVGERLFWWLREQGKRDPQKLEQILAALENSDVPAAKKLSAHCVRSRGCPVVCDLPRAMRNWPPLAR